MRCVAVVREITVAVFAFRRDTKRQLIVDGNILGRIDVLQIKVPGLQVDPGLAVADDRAVADDVDRSTIRVPAVDGSLRTAQYFDPVDVIESGSQALRAARI